MIRSIRRSLLIALCFIVGALLALCAGARAGQVLYVFAGRGTGRAGDVEFADAEFTLTLAADAADVAESDPGLFSVSGRSTVDITGVGAGDFLIATRVFSSFSAFVEVPAVGFSILGSGDGPDLVDLTAPAFAGYTLRAVRPRRRPRAPRRPAVPRRGNQPGATDLRLHFGRPFSGRSSPAVALRLGGRDDRGGRSGCIPHAPTASAARRARRAVSPTHAPKTPR